MSPAAPRPRRALKLRLAPPPADPPRVGVVRVETLHPGYTLDGARRVLDYAVARGAEVALRLADDRQFAVRPWEWSTLTLVYDEGVE